MFVVILEIIYHSFCNVGHVHRLIEDLDLLHFLMEKKVHTMSATIYFIDSFTVVLKGFVVLETLTISLSGRYYIFSCHDPRILDVV